MKEEIKHQHTNPSTVAVPKMTHAEISAAIRGMDDDARIAFVQGEVARRSASDTNVGIEWSSTDGTQRIVGWVNGGGTAYLTDPMYEVVTVGDGDVRRYPASGIQDTINRDIYRLTPAYAEAEAEAKQRQIEASLREEEANAATIASEQRLKPYLNAATATPLQRGRLQATLSQTERRKVTSTGKHYSGTRFDLTAELIDDGFRPVVEEVTVKKDTSRMSLRERRDRQGRKDTRKEYLMACGNSHFIVTKAEYDLATWLVETSDPQVHNLGGDVNN